MRHILTIKSGGIGDVLLAVPALEAIKRRFHPCSLTFMGPPPLLPLLAGLVSRTVSIESPALATWMGPEPDEALVPFFTKHDLIVSWFGYHDAGFRRNIESVAPGRARFFPPFPAGTGVHISDYYLRCLDTSDKRDTSHGFLTTVCPRASSDIPSGFSLAIHPGSGAGHKNWPPERFAALAQWAIECHDAQILLISGPADAQSADAVCRVFPQGKIHRAHCLPLPRLAELLSGSSVFVGNDSGVSHLSAAVGCRTIALFGPTDPRVWGPRGPCVSPLWKGLPCAPCPREKASQCRPRKCLEDISVGDVVECLSS